MHISFSRIIFYLLLGCLFSTLEACSFKQISGFNNITYLQGDSLGIPQQKLTVFSPKKRNGLEEVLIFIHGGSWNSGKKSLYNFLGKRFARKGVVAVIIDYPLSPKADYLQMAISSVIAVQWVRNNIEQYGGNPDKIFVSGHSAGGHLAALISVRNEYFNLLGMENPIKGCILIDAAGLDMYGYMKEQNFAQGHTYLNTFTADPDTWKLASPLYHLHQQMPPFLIYRGEKTYPSIIKSTEKFIKALGNYTTKPAYKVQAGKKHIPMITQFLWTRNPLYDEILEFMQSKP
jgi:acetyl esterase/lipase